MLECYGTPWKYLHFLRSCRSQTSPSRAWLQLHACLVLACLLAIAPLELPLELPLDLLSSLLSSLDLSMELWPVVLLLEISFEKSHTHRHLDTLGYCQSQKFKTIQVLHLFYHVNIKERDCDIRKVGLKVST